MTQNDYQPTDEDLEFLNKVDKGYVGLIKPKVEYHIETVYYEEPDVDWRMDVDQE